MKNILFLIPLFIATQCTAQSKDELTIRKIMDEQTRAWNRGDLESFMKGYWENDSLMFIGSRGITYGWNNTLANYKKGYPDTVSMGKLSMELISAKMLSPEYCYVTGKWHLSRNVGDAAGHFTLLFRKINDTWLIIADHSS